MEYLIDLKELQASPWNGSSKENLLLAIAERLERIADLRQAQIDERKAYRELFLQMKTP